MTEAKSNKRQRLEKKLQDTKNEIKKLDAVEKEQKRKIENRTKIIIGGTVLKHMQHDPDFKKQITTLLAKHGRQQDKDFLSRHKLISGFNKASEKQKPKTSPQTSKQTHHPTG